MTKYEQKIKTRVKKKIIKQVTMVDSKAEKLITSGVDGLISGADTLTKGEFELKTIQSGTFKKLAPKESMDSSTVSKKLKFSETKKTEKKLRSKRKTQKD